MYLIQLSTGAKKNCINDLIVGLYLTAISGSYNESCFRRTDSNRLFVPLQVANNFPFTTKTVSQLIKSSFHILLGARFRNEQTFGVVGDISWWTIFLFAPKQNNKISFNPFKQDLSSEYTVSFIYVNSSCCV